MNVAPKTLRQLSDVEAAGLTGAEQRAALEQVAAQYAVAITPAMAELIDRTDAADPIARQFVPGAAELGQSAIGQRDVTMTALQAAVMAGTVANKGTRMQPYLVNRITDAQMKDSRTTKPKKADQAVNEETAATLTDLMYASERSSAGYDGNCFASKTGTAEHGEGLAPHVWYVAFDPERDIAVGVVVKNGGNLGESATGGKVSGPIGRAILRAYQGEQ